MQKDTEKMLGEFIYRALLTAGICHTMRDGANPLVQKTAGETLNHFGKALAALNKVPSMTKIITATMQRAGANIELAVKKVSR